MTGLLVRLGLGWLGRWIRAAAEGKKGPGLASAYAFLQGRKTAWGVLLGCVTAALLYLGYTEPAEALTGPLAGLLIGSGLLDKGWRSAPPPDGIGFLRNHAGDLTAVGSLLAAAFVQCDGSTAALLARVHLSCQTALISLGVLGAVLAQLGVEVKFAAPPALPGGAK